MSPPTPHPFQAEMSQNDNEDPFNDDDVANSPEAGRSWRALCRRAPAPGDAKVACGGSARGQRNGEIEVA
jgi:hypothetical protein